MILLILLAPLSAGVEPNLGFPVQLFDTKTYVDGADAMAGKAPSVSGFLPTKPPSTTLGDQQAQAKPSTETTLLPPIQYRVTNITMDTQSIPLDWADTWSPSESYQFNQKADPVYTKHFVPDITSLMIDRLKAVRGGQGILASALVNKLYQINPPTFSAPTSSSSKGFVNSDFAKKYSGGPR